MKMYGKDIRFEGRLVRMARLADEGFEFLDEDPKPALAGLRGEGVDIFTFMERLPHTAPRFDYAVDWDNVAALAVSTFEHWWTKQIDGKTRNMVRRAEKKGIMVREVPFDDALAKGIWHIYNECPVRQGRPFQHYGKDFETIREMSATFLETSVFIGAFLDERLIGFVKLTVDDTRTQATVMHIISMIQQRDKSPTNALIAASVRACEQRNVPNLVYSRFAYGKKQRDSLSDFKESNGFKQIDLPRYYIPLTPLGHFALRLGLHRSVLELVPEPVIAKLREIRNDWYGRKIRATLGTS